MDYTSGCPTSRGVWSVPEHERFIEAMSLYPRGPWKLITDHVGTRSIKQVQTHAQKYQQKLLRQQRGLRKRKVNVKRPEHRVDPTTLGQFTHKCIVRYAQRLGKEQGQDHMDDDDELHPEMPMPMPVALELSASASSSAVSSPTSAGSVDTNFVGATLGDWLAMTKDAAADAKLLELLPEIFPTNEDDDALGMTKQQCSQEWSVQQLDALLRPAAASQPLKPETTAMLFDPSNAPAPSA